MHGELPQSEAQKKSCHRHFAGHLAAYGHRNIGAIGASNCQCDQLQHRGMQGIVQIGNTVVGAIDRQRVLNQIIGADRNKV